MHHQRSKRTDRGFSAASVLSVLLILCIPPEIQAQAITMSPPVQLAAGGQDHLFTEPHVATSPTDPNHLLGAAMISPVGEDFADDVRPRMRCAAFLSLDAGSSWVRHDFPLTECFDPWVSITPDGRAIFTALASRSALADRELVVLVSPDGGRTWPDAPVVLGAGHDHPTNAVELGVSGRDVRFHILSSRNLRTEEGNRRRAVVLQTSVDGGETFNPPVRVLMSNRFHNAETAAVLSDGALAIGFTTTTWSSSDEPRRAWIVLARSGGSEISIPLFVTDACGPPRFALSALAAGPAPEAEGERLYFACNALGGDSVVVISSSNRGEEWSEAVSIHRTPPARADALRHVRGLAVNGGGVLGVVWADRWGSRDEDRCYEGWFTASLDGGRTFLPARSLTDGTVCMKQTTHGALMRAHPTGGDYWGLAAASDGKFHVVWAEPGEGSLLRLRTAALDVP